MKLANCRKNFVCSTIWYIQGVRLGMFLDQRNCFVVLTSVSGHLLQHQFPSTHKNWVETPMTSLFDIPLQKGVIPGMGDIRSTLLEESRQCDVSFSDSLFSQQTN